MIERLTTQQFLPEEELFLLTNGYIRSYLANLIQTDFKWMIFITANVVFQKITDENEKMNIFSSHRNQNWIIPTSPDQDNILTIADSLDVSGDISGCIFF